MKQNQVAEGEKRVKQKKHWILGNPWVAAVLVPLLLILLVSFVDELLKYLMKLLPAYAANEESFGTITESVARYITVLIAVLAMKRSSKGAFRFGFSGKRLKASLLLSLLALSEVVAAIIQGLIYKSELQSGLLNIISVIMLSIGAGVFEEPLCRGIVMSNMMSKWVGKKQRIVLSVFGSGIFFGLIHLFSLQTQPVLYVVTQVVHAFGIGVFFGAVYARTRNLWGTIIIHALFDTGCLIFVQNAQLSTNDIIISFAWTLFYIAMGLFFIRPSKRAEIEEIWNDEPAQEASSEGAGARA